MVKSRYIGDGHPTFNRVDDHPLLYGNNGSLDPGTHGFTNFHVHPSLASAVASALPMFVVANGIDAASLERFMTSQMMAGIPTQNNSRLKKCHTFMLLDDRYDLWV